ncbi:FecCD family ABC transporter permease [Dermatobacter hominis]|uniref:FecCD family ABC transporter permease n=1 Tax=Dermatobacter hominis TaxID=2884263 RepID=UPI001D100F28|nr:iron chelate uptake ABC transporter family permease subunit [Dermatobacter hominis]UDY37376.1 iron chelate uptake ABC transporter family permease subunit [Dermatobacter hominis]
MSDAGLRPPISGLVLRSSRFGFSFRTDLRAVVVTVLLLAATSVVFAWSMAVGDFPVAISDVISIVFGGTGEGGSEFIVRELRLPRATLGVVVGAAFGVAGALFQRVADNPLASPDVIGINSGAAAAAVATIVLWSGTVDQVTAAALVGGVGTAVLIYVLSYRSGITGYRLVLVGIGMSALLRAVISYLLAKAQLVDATRASVWMVGSLNGRGWDDLVPVAVALVVLVPVAMASGRQLRMLELGVDTAIGLGSSVRRTQALMLLVGVALAALATAAAGPIAFVSLASPQIAKRLTGVRTVGLLPAAATGALLLLASDLIARRLFAPTEIPVGIVTGVLGAPFLLYLLAVGNRIGRG